MPKTMHRHNLQPIFQFGVNEKTHKDNSNVYEVNLTHRKIRDGDGQFELLRSTLGLDDKL